MEHYNQSIVDAPITAVLDKTSQISIFAGEKIQ